MNERFNPQPPRTSTTGFVRAVAACCLALVLSSCAGTVCEYCDVDECGQDSPRRWNVELARPVLDQNTGRWMHSYTSLTLPVKISGAAGQDVIRLQIPRMKDGVCAGKETVTVPASDVARITTAADPILPPEEVMPGIPCVNCTRERRGLLVFDKVELRMMGGYRGTQTAYFYPDATGGTLWEPKTFGFDRGGTEITVGGEAAFLWNVAALAPRTMFHLGVLTGVWPVDGSVFVPVSVHPRVTFNNNPDPYGCSCNAWYIFGDAGIASLGGSQAPYTPVFDKRFFFGAGIGYEWAVGRNLDAGLDVFYRRQILPLPRIDCCPDIPVDLRNPLRKVHLFGLRLGVTF